MQSRLTIASLLLVAALGCRQEPAVGVAVGHDSWAITSWGERYEVFAETGALIAGTAATSNAHVTILDGFAPLKEGVVSIVLRSAGPEQIFRQNRPKRDGIFPIEVRPSSEGTYELFFQVDGPSGQEEIAAGRVRVGTAATPGGLADESAEAAPGGIPFLKEQQWQTAFATAPVTEATLNESVAAPARVTPAAGGEVTLTAGFDATVTGDPWPYPGLDVAKGRTVVRLLPRVGERSLPELQAEASALTAEVDAVRRRVDRLTELLKVEATSVAELERARATLAALEARLQSARQGVAAAGAGRSSADDLTIAMKAPWPGRVAEVLVSPGQTVAAGTALARLVKLRPLWIVMALRPEDAARVQGSPAGLLLRRSGASEVVEVSPGEIRIVSRSPEVDPRTASISLIVEADRSAPDLPIGTSVEAELLLATERNGIVVPASALIDDSGVLVAYVQDEGESFSRREVRALVRQAGKVLVEGLQPGERLVMLGGAAIRRSSLLSSGAPEGHVH